MRSKDKEEIKKELQDKLEKLKKELAQLRKKDGTFTADRAHGRLGKIDAMQNKGFHERSIRSLVKEIDGLENNLKALDGPDFGVCEYCKGPIGEERREALPETKMCIKCANRHHNGNSR